MGPRFPCIYGLLLLNNLASRELGLSDHNCFDILCLMLSRS